MSVKSAALERLLLLTLAAFAGAAVLLMAFATRLSVRIRRLRDEAESAIDARGRIARLTAGSSAGDEIGDLSRSFSAVLERLAEHHAYLEAMAGRLSHELRTPIAVVRSSLENLKLSRRRLRPLHRARRAGARAPGPDPGAHDRGFAPRAEPERRRARAATTSRRWCAAASRATALAYPQSAFVLELPPGRVEVEGSPDLAAQLLDKLVENAVDFSRPGAPVRVALEQTAAVAALTVSNKGPLLPDKMRTRLFESMISVRDAPAPRRRTSGLGSTSRA